MLATVHVFNMDPQAEPTLVLTLALIPVTYLWRSWAGNLRPAPCVCLHVLLVPGPRNNVHFQNQLAHLN